MKDYKVTLTLNAVAYESWKRFLTTRDIQITGKGSSLIGINSETFTMAINKIVCSAENDCFDCSDCKYDTELKEIGIL